MYVCISENKDRPRLYEQLTKGLVHPRFMAQASSVPCALCFAAAGPTTVVVCGTCKERRYCSASCRAADWGVHKQWCGRSSETGVGFDIRDAGPSKGQGVFALRDFEVGDKIMVEGPSLQAEHNSPVALADLRALSESTCAHLMAMSPLSPAEAVGEEAVLAALQLKFTNNAIDLGDGMHTSGLFLTICRVNHDCVGNCEHYYLAEHGVMMLVATRNIRAGQEVTFSYVSDCATHGQRTEKLMHWGIHCQCSVCAAPAGATGEALDRMAKLDATLLAQGSRGKIDKALKTGRKLLDLYAEHSSSLMLRSRTCYDMFGLAVTQRSSQAEAQRLIDESVALDCMFFGRADLSVCQEKQGFASDISSHPYYLKCEPPGKEGAGSDEEGGSVSGGEGGGSVEDGGTSDEDDFPKGVGVSTTFDQGMRTSNQLQLASALSDGAAMLGAQLDVDACAGAQRECLHLRDEAESSYLFSSATSARAPPCAAESVFLDGATLARGSGGADAEALQRAIKANAAGAHRALLSLGYAASQVQQVGLPMASVGTEAALAERFHRGAEGAPALHHRPRDGLDAQGTRPSSLVLTSILVLDDRTDDDRGHEVAPAMLRTVRAHGKKRRLPQGSADAGTAAEAQVKAEAEGTPGGSWCETSFHPRAGDLLLLRPDVLRSLAGQRVSITLWWQIDARAAAASLAVADLPSACPPPPLTRLLAGADTSASGATASAEPLVFDGMIAPTTRAALSSMPPVRFGIYDRHVTTGLANAHEALIESVLVSLGDTSRWVEYWGRAAWQAIPAHSDLDEIPLLAPRAPNASAPRPRFPKWAHIVYLDVASGQPAPTVLYDDESSAARRFYVVPAVPARLLRFDGSWVHAVPKPTAELLGERESEAEESNGASVLRHVLLFNSWPDAPPEGSVSTSASVGGAVPMLQSDAACGAKPFAAWKASQIVARGTSADGMRSATVGPILAASLGQTGAGEAAPSEATTAAVSRLMGGPRRRGRSVRFRCDTLASPHADVRAALHELVDPSSFQIL